MPSLQFVALLLVSSAFGSDVEIYARHCASCHGAFGAGDGTKGAELQTPVPDLSDASFWAEREPAQTTKSLKKGMKSESGDETMPEFKTALSPEQIAEVDAFTRLFPTLPSTDSATKGAAVFADSCAQCHGDTGVGDGPLTKGLTQTVADLTDPALWERMTEVKLVERIRLGDSVHGGIMPEHGDQLTYPQIYDLVQHLQTFRGE